jgi:hypothetical protein
MEPASMDAAAVEAATAVAAAVLGQRGAGTQAHRRHGNEQRTG